MIHLATGPSADTAPQARNSIYLPIVAKEPADMPPEAAVFAQLLCYDERQQRVGMAWCPALQRAAMWRANDMAALRYFAHCNPAGVCPNAVAAASGCRLPADYAQNGNNIESIAAGSPSPAVILDALGNSPKHADHLFGRGEVFRQQTHYAIGYVAMPGSVYGFYWCVMISVCQ